MWALPTALCGLLLIGHLSGNRSAAGVSFVLLANWGLCAAFSAATGDATNWLSLAVFDYLGAIVLALTMRSRWQILVVALYAAMLCAHVAYSLAAVAPFDLSARSYFLVLTVLAWAQAASVGGWVVAEYLAVRRAADPDRRASSAEALSREMGAEP